MGGKSAIEWTDATWTPIRARYVEIQNDGSGKGRLGWHCERVSPGCKNCYAEAFNMRLGTGLEFKPGHLFREEHVGYANGESRLFLDENILTAPLRWRRPRRIFVCSMTDLFADFVPDEWIDRMFAIMALCPQHTFQVLTKRPQRMRDYMMEKWQGTRPMRVAGIDVPAGGVGGRRHQIDQACVPLLQAFGLADRQKDELWTDDGKCRAMQWDWPLPNVWLGISAEDQQRFDERWPFLSDTPAAVRFISYEPALGPLDLKGARPDWIICGGESGHGARPMHPDWPRSIRDQCAAAGVPFFFKQWGEWTPGVNVERRSGIVRSATWFDERWLFGRENLANEDGHIDDEPDLYRVGKKCAGRLLDGHEHNAFPQVRP